MADEATATQEPQTSFEDLVKMMMSADLERVQAFKDQGGE